MPAPTALAVFFAGIAGRQTVLRDPSRRTIEAIRGQTLATIEERHRATPCSGPALVSLQRAFGKDDRALKGLLFEDDSPASTPAADAKFAAGHAVVTSEGRKVF
jgi:hypothetical protein